MKQRIPVFLLWWIMSFPAKADVIYSPMTSFNLAASWELIFNFEDSFSKWNTLNVWGGGGIVSSSVDMFGPSLGLEAAFELRHYFRRDSYKGLNVGLYGGMAYMRHYEIAFAKITHEYNSIGVVPGIKLCYKHDVNPWLVSEPYIGISIPFHHELDQDSHFFTPFENLGIILTVGIRIGWNSFTPGNKR